MISRASVQQCILVVLSIVALSAQTVTSRVEHSIKVSVRAGAEGRFIYRINGHDAKDPLDGFREAFRNIGRQHPVIIVVEDTLPASIVRLAPAFPRKVGFEDVRTFIYSADDPMMVEVSLGARSPTPTWVSQVSSHP